MREVILCNQHEIPISSSLGPASPAPPLRLASTIATTSASSASPVRSISTRGTSAPDEGGHPVQSSCNHHAIIMQSSCNQNAIRMQSACTPHLDQRHQRTCIHDGRLPGLRPAGERLQSTGSKPACLRAAKQLDQKAHRPGCRNLAIYHLVAGARELPQMRSSVVIRGNQRNLAIYHLVAGARELPQMRSSVVIRGNQGRQSCHSRWQR